MSEPNKSIYACFEPYKGTPTSCLSGSDKGTAHTYYLEVYDDLFKDMRNAPIRLLELGVQSGGSLAAWSDYFSNDATRILGVDIDLGGMKHSFDSRVKVLRADATTTALSDTIAQNTSHEPVHGWQAPYDIIIDDASHRWEHQVASLCILGPLLKSNGIYVVEDITTPSKVELIETMARTQGMKTFVYDGRDKSGDPYDMLIVCKK